MAHPLRATVKDWLAVIEEGKRVKHERFGQYAEECEKFYDSAHNWMWKNDYSKGPQGFVEAAGEIPYPTFQMTMNRVFEAVAIFGPAMFQRYPQAQVTPVSPPTVPPELFGIPPEHPAYLQIVAQQEQPEAVRKLVAELKQHYLNWLQVETNKKTHARKSITDGLVAGLGLFYHEWYQPDGSNLSCPRSRHISWKRLIKDPDATNEEDVQWIAIEFTEPVNLVEEQYGLKPDSLKANLQSVKSQTSGRGKKNANSNNKDSFDLIKYYKVFSINGLGDKLKRAKPLYDLSSLGKRVHIVVAPGVEFPLNLPEERMQDEQSVLEAVQWPIPFWLDSLSGNGWPVTELFYYDKGNCVWPVSLFKPVIGPMRFVNWVLSFLADKVASSSHEYLAIMKAAAKDIKDQLLNQKGPFKIIELSETLGAPINQVIDLLEKPTFDVGIYDMAERMMRIIDKGTGLTDIVYGATHSQMRSATEAGVKEGYASIRPDDMGEKTDDWYSAALSKEMMTLAYLGEREDVVDVLGELGAEVFDREVFSQDPEKVAREYSYRIAAGSARKPNKAMLLQSLTEFGQVAAPMLQGFAQSGITGPWNAYAFDIAKALDLPDPERYMVQLPPQEEQGPSPEEMESVQKQQEMIQDEAKFQQEYRQREQEHEQKIELERAKALSVLELAKVKAQTAKVAARSKGNGKK